MSNIVILELLGVSVIGYLLGSISFGVLVGHYYGIDPLKKGSKSPGATNVTRLMGPGAGRFVFIFDFLKGMCAAGWPMLPFLNTAAPLQLSMLGCAAAVVGHSYSMFLNFKGGKAVATVMGGLFVLMPLGTLIGIAVWYATFRLSKYVSLASICFAISLPISALSIPRYHHLILFVTALALFVILRHRANIERLIKGTENHFRKKKS
jgi:glycerol-3-phosphate acyltransferase PlsY